MHTHKYTHTHGQSGGVHSCRPAAASFTWSPGMIHRCDVWILCARQKSHFTAIRFLGKKKQKRVCSSCPPHLLRLSNLCDGVEELLITGGRHCGCASFSGELSWKAGSLRHRTPQPLCGRTPRQLLNARRGAVWRARTLLALYGVDAERVAASCRPPFRG